MPSPQPLLIRAATCAIDGRLQRLDLLLRDGKISRIGEGLAAEGAAVFDARGLVAGPGFIDLHVHGGGGHSFFTTDPGRVRAYAAWAPAHGLTGFLISTAGATHEDTLAILHGLRPALAAPGPGAEPLGFHLEGPCLNPARKGAFPASFLRPVAAGELAELLEAADGRLRVVTLAPELPGADRLVDLLCRAGIVAAAGHTDATFQEAAGAFARGVSHVTHLFNAMRPLHQREGGPVVAALLADPVTCELICDGAHVAPEVLRLAYRALGPSRTVIVTDNLHLAGTVETGGSFGGAAVSVSGAAARRDDGVIVGSIAPMDQHFRNAIDFLGIDVATAFRLCAENPARVAGVASRKGRLAPGFNADLVLLDEARDVVATVCRGELAFSREPSRL